MTEVILPFPTENPPAHLVLSVQILRGVAALLVVLFHYSHYLKSVAPGADIGFQMFGGGYVGVDIFFIVSGFIIVHSTEQRHNARPLDFLIRRFFRVVPLAQIATLINFSVMSARPSLTLLWKSLLFLPSAEINPPKFGYPVVAQAWTLSYELVFYGIFAAVLLCTQRNRVVAAASIIVAFVIGFQWVLGGPISLRPNGVWLPTGYQGLVPPEYLGTLGNPIMLEFILGMAMAVAYLRVGGWLQEDGRRLAGRIAGISLMGIFFYSYLSRSDPGNGLLDKGAGAACLVVGALLWELTCRPHPVAARPGACLSLFLWLGAISYPLYLVHEGIAERLLRFLSIRLLGITVDGIWGLVALITTSLVLAWVAHVFLEQYFIRAGKRLIAHKDRLAA